MIGVPSAVRMKWLGLTRVAILFILILAVDTKATNHPESRHASRAASAVSNDKRAPPKKDKPKIPHKPKQSSREINDKLPNIVFILADDLGYNDISLHGGASWATPNIDGIAARGVAFENYYVQPVCSPTRASLLTGRHVIHTGIYNAFAKNAAAYLSTQYTLLPTYLNRVGNYSSHLIGKWHLGFENARAVPEARGFDSFLGFFNAAADYFSHAVQGIWDFFDGSRPAFEYRGEYSPDVFEEKTLEFLQTPRAVTDPPFFLYLSLQAVHSPYEQTTNADDWAFCGLCTSDFNRQSVCAMIQKMDRTVGAVLKTLADQKLENKTIVIFSSDNGGPNSGAENGSNNFPLRGGKSSLWEGGVRSIGLMQAPPEYMDAVGRGHKYSGKFHITDWVPTLVEMLAGDGRGLEDFMLPSEPPILLGDGVSQAAALKSAAVLYPRDWVLLETRPESVEACLSFANSTPPCLPFLWHGDGFIVGNMKIVQNIPVYSYGVVKPGGTVELISPPQSSQRKRRALSQLNGWIEPPDYVPLSPMPPSARRLACPPPPSNVSEYSTQCMGAFCLFDLAADPCEHNDLANERPQIVQEMGKMLAVLRRTAVLGPSMGSCFPVTIAPDGGQSVPVFAPCAP